MHRFEDGESAVVRAMALSLALLSKRNWDMSWGQSFALTNTTLNIPISEGGTTNSSHMHNLAKS